MNVTPQASELNTVLKSCNNSIFSLLSKRGLAAFFPKDGILVQSAQARGKKINATIGIATEDDSSPMRLPSIAKLVSLPAKDVFPYAPSAGRQDLRDAWKKLMLQKNPSLSTPISNSMVTCALSHGLSLIGFLFVDPNDTILVHDMYWNNYDLIYEVGFDAKMETYNTFKFGSFDVESMKNKLVGGGKKILLLNFPNNPCGYTPTNNEAAKITQAILDAANSGSKILVVLDDAYFGLVFEDGVTKESLFSKLANIHPNVLAIKLDGATKEDYVWGLRVGFITYGFSGATPQAYAALEEKTEGAIRSTISMASNLSQSLVVAGITSPTYAAEKLEKFNIIKSRYLEVKRVLSNKKFVSVFEPLPFNSGYFMCVKPLKADPEKVRRVLLEKYDTGVICLGNVIRVAYSSVSQKSIEQLFENIYNACLDCESAKK